MKNLKTRGEYRKKMAHWLASGLSREEKEFIFGAGMAFELVPPRSTPARCTSEYEAFQADWASVAADFWIAVLKEHESIPHKGMLSKRRDQLNSDLQGDSDDRIEKASRRS